VLNETNVGIFTNDAVTKCLIFGYEIFIRFKAAAHYKISLRQDDYTDMWNITTFKITAVRHLEFFRSLHFVQRDLSRQRSLLSYAKFN